MIEPRIPLYRGAGLDVYYKDLYTEFPIRCVRSL
jgi:hypothetical protein